MRVRMVSARVGEGCSFVLVARNSVVVRLAALLRPRSRPRVVFLWAKGVCGGRRVFPTGKPVLEREKKRSVRKRVAFRTSVWPFLVTSLSRKVPCALEDRAHAHLETKACVVAAEVKGRERNYRSDVRGAPRPSISSGHATTGVDDSAEKPPGDSEDVRGALRSVGARGLLALPSMAACHGSLGRRRCVLPWRDLGPLRPPSRDGDDDYYCPSILLLWPAFLSRRRAFAPRVTGCLSCLSLCASS